MKNRNIFITFFFVFFALLGIIYINKSYIDIVFLDGFTQVPIVEKYFNGTLVFSDFLQKWGDHRLTGYTLFFLLNTIFFGLNMKLEPFVFLLSYFFIGLFLFFYYKEFLLKTFKKNINQLMVLFYIPILFLVFSLVHPPLMLMTTQFVIGTLFFVLFVRFFDRICLGSVRWLDLFWFLLLFTLYITLFSGANFGGVLLGFVVCIFIKIFFSKNKRINVLLILSLLFTFLLSSIYLSIKADSLDGINLAKKVVMYVANYKESFLSILAGISATTLDIHTFEEFLGSRELIILINGSVLLLLGIYSVFKYILLKIYKVTYIPILLIFYSFGHVIITKLGRLGGGWTWPMNEWYSFHLYFYLIGILWILFYDVFDKYIFSSKKNFKYFLKKNKWTLGIFIFSIFWIFSFQAVSNMAQWRRGPYIKDWLEVKRTALLFPTDENIEVLLWDKEDILKDIEIMKKNKLSVFREGGFLSKQNGVIKLFGWYSDNWVSKNVIVKVLESKEGLLFMNVYIPEDVFNNVYKQSLLLQIVENEEIIGEKQFSDGSFEGGNPVDLVFDISKGISSNIEIRLNKSYVPNEYGLGKDTRDLGLIINKIEVK